MKKIVFVLGTFHRGGAERVISILANDYARRGWNVSVLLLLDNVIEYEVNNNIEFVDMTAGGYSSSIIKKLLRIPYWIWKLRKYICENKPASTVVFTGNISTLVLMSLLGTKESIIVSERIDPKQRKRYWLESLIRDNLWGSRYCKTVVFQTMYAKSCYPKSIQRKSVIIGNPIEVKASRKEEKKKIVSVGRLTTQKNQKLLIHAFYQLHKRYDDLELVIYGEGELRTQLEKLISELQLKDVISLPGNIMNIHEKIADAMLFVFPSRYEGLSNALLEAMMIGLPCIVSDINGVREIIEDGKNGLLFQDDSLDDLIEKMEHLIKDKEKRNILSKNAKMIKERYSKDNVMKEWIRVLE